MEGSPSPTSPTKFTFDSFDLEGIGVAKSGEGDPSPPAAASTCPSPTSQGGEADKLVQEVTRLYRERYRLARMHRKAELRVLASLRRRKQGEDRNQDVEDEDGHTDWTGQVTSAREALLEADQTVSAKELHYRLLLENSQTNAANSAKQAATILEGLIEQQQQLVKQSFSSLPPEKDRKQTVDDLLKRQMQVEEQLKQARTTYFSLVLKKQCQEELQRRQAAAEDQVSVAEMLRLVVETEAFTEEGQVQECSLSTYKASLKNMVSTIDKHNQQKKELAEHRDKEESRVAELKSQLNEEKQKLKTLSKKQVISKKKSARLQPSSRLLLDPVLAKDLKEKLALKVSLENEVHHLKQEISMTKTVLDLWDHFTFNKSYKSILWKYR